MKWVDAVGDQVHRDRVVAAVADDHDRVPCAEAQDVAADLCAVGVSGRRATGALDRHHGPVHRIDVVRGPDRGCAVVVLGENEVERPLRRVHRPGAHRRRGMREPRCGEHRQHGHSEDPADHESTFSDPVRRCQPGRRSRLAAVRADQHVDDQREPPVDRDLELGVVEREEVLERPDQPARRVEQRVDDVVRRVRVEHDEQHADRDDRRHHRDHHVDHACEEPERPVRALHAPGPASIAARTSSSRGSLPNPVRHHVAPAASHGPRSVPPGS